MGNKRNVTLTSVLQNVTCPNGQHSVISTQGSSIGGYETYMYKHLKKKVCTTMKSRYLKFADILHVDMISTKLKGTK